MSALGRRVGASRGGDPRGEAGPEARPSGGLTQRLIAASGLLALIIAGAFGVLLLAIDDLRDAARRADHSQDVLIAANELDRLLLDLETGQRGFILTRQERFLGPWNAARAQFPRRSAALLRLVAGNPAAEPRAAEIAQAMRAYVSEYSGPLVDAARRGEPSARSVSAAVAGKRRVDAMRIEFDRLLDAERHISADSTATADSAARRASAAALAGLAGSIALIALYVGYLTRAMLRPVRRAARMAARVAGGDLSARMPETGPGEVGALERTFNVMASSLERGRDELAALAAEQAALRRVATAVARAAPPATVFAVVAEEVGRLIPADIAVVARYDDHALTAVGSWRRTDDLRLVGTSVDIGGRNVSTLVYETRRPARLDSYADASGGAAAQAHERGVGSAVGVPITVAGRLWGVMIVATTHGAVLPSGTEHRLTEFTELVATAIANTEARQELHRVADEQAALRRVATLVAHASPPQALFAAVAEEVGRLLGADLTAMARYDADGAATIVAGWSRTGDRLGTAHSGPLGGRNVATLVFETRGPARVDSYGHDAGWLPRRWLAAAGLRSAVGAPISVEGRLWGVAIVGSTTDAPLPRGTEERLADFTELVATAIANAESGAELTASRARIVATADETRRRIERDLHDGAQQRLVSLALQLRGAQSAVPPELGELEAGLADIAAGLTDVLDDLREMARGIHPAILAEGGLGPALKTLARRSPVPVEVDVHTGGRLPEAIEVGAYYVVSEALTNAAKHAHASSIGVDVEAVDTVLRVCVRDDGVGGAHFAPGSGLVGLKDRVEALGGRIALDSARDAGTALQVVLPLRVERESESSA